MTAPKYAEARALRERVEEDLDRFDAFLMGYLHGAADEENDAIPPAETDEFRQRLRKLYREENPECFL